VLAVTAKEVVDLYQTGSIARNLARVPAENVLMSVETTMTKVKLRTPDHAYLESEVVWADDLGNGYYRLQNVPLHAIGCSLHDIVLARRSNRDYPTATRVVIRSGHVTGRVTCRPDRPEAFELAVHQVKELGCSCEGDGRAILGVDMPPAVDPNLVERRFREGEGLGLWEFEVPSAASMPTPRRRSVSPGSRGRGPSSGPSASSR